MNTSDKIMKQMRRDVNWYLYRNELSKDISANIRERRRKLGISQKELARLSGLLQPNISRLERPNYKAYSVNTLVKLALAMQTTV